MKTSPEWATFKTTRLLYAIVILLLVNFYLIHSAFSHVEEEVPLLNAIYVIATLTILFVCYSIYSIRHYLQTQMEKHSLHDHETGLFNKKYFLTELRAAFEGANRHEKPLSMISASFTGKSLKQLSKQNRQIFMQDIGDIFTSVTRLSDIVCRYDVNHIMVLLPLTEGDEAHILEGRLQDALENFNFQITPKVMFNLTSSQAEWDEQTEAFLQRLLA